MLIDKNTFIPSKIKNRYEIVKSFSSGQTKIKALPNELILEITNNCNLACIMCPRPNMERYVGSMEFDLFKKIIDQAKEYVDLLYIAGGLGEPTMHKKLEEMIAYARIAGVRVGISTNATLLNPKICQTIFSAKPDLILLSLDGASKEIHEKIRVGSDFEETMSMLEYFLREKQRKNIKQIYTIVQMIYMSENQIEKDRFRMKWYRYKGINEIRMKKFIRLQGASDYPENISEITENQYKSCILPWRQLSISWDGKVAICCRDLNYTEQIGDVSVQSISEIWNSYKMISYRKMIASGSKRKISICKNCTGIPANFAIKVGVILFDNLTIRKILPLMEKIVLRTGMKALDYS